MLFGFFEEGSESHVDPSELIESALRMITTRLTLSWLLDKGPTCPAVTASIRDNLLRAWYPKVRLKRKMIVLLADLKLMMHRRGFSGGIVDKVLLDVNSFEMYGNICNMKILIHYSEQISTITIWNINLSNVYISPSDLLLCHKVLLQVS